MSLFGSAGVNPVMLKKELIGGEAEVRNYLKFGLKSTQAMGTVVVTCR